MLYTLSDIQTILQADWLQCRRANAPVEQLLIDSRQITMPGLSLFFALPGKRHDGHQFLQELYRAGLRNFIVSHPPAFSDLPEANILLVHDTLKALQALAAHHRAQFHIPVIGITGSNGKTVIKEWLYQLLAPDRNIVRSPKSYNSQTGVPLSVWQLQAGHELAIFEAGISQPGEMAALARIIRPTIGLFTNIGPAHREGFATKMDKVLEKMQLFEGVDMLVYCKDHDKIAEAVGTTHWPAGTRLFSWSGKGLPADLQIEDVQFIDPGHARIRGLMDGQIGEIVIPFADPASVENAIHCWALLHLLGVPQSDIETRMQQLEPVEMRLEIKAGADRCLLINDAYNNDTASLRIALQFAAQQTRKGPLTLILSDILQSGQAQTALYEKVAGIIRENGVQRVLGVGTAVPVLQNFLPPEIAAHFYPTTEALLEALPAFGFHDERILLKGARPFAFERVAERLQQKAHKTVLEINLSALVHNLNVYTKLLRPGTKTMAMVKASAYGSGAAEVAKLLEFHKVDYLGVAYADEGVELREAGVKLPVLVLNPEPASFDVLYRYQLEPEVYSPGLLEEIIAYAGREKTLSIHLKLDTGMHRLGFESADIPVLVARLKAYPNLKVQTVFSHLAAGDAPAHDAFTHRQAAIFTQLYEQIRAGIGYAPIRHLANTGGVARFPEYHFDMVRLGIGLYGIGTPELQAQLRVVNTLKATISQIKEIAPGDTVGYNRNSGLLERPTRIATISLGYADGFLRLAGNGRYAVGIRGQLAPTIGNVCMDMTMVDISRIPEAKEGDTVVVFGEYPKVQGLAECFQTIPYEVFTNVSDRVKRVYLQE